MGTRGRHSSVGLSIVTPFGNVKRPEPLPELTPEQAAEWRAVVDRMSPDWFPRETHGLLVQYCRQVVTARRVGQLIAAAESADPFDVREYERLLKCQNSASAMIASLATKMRICQSSTYDKSKKKPAQGKRPWDDAESA